MTLNEFQCYASLQVTLCETNLYKILNFDDIMYTSLHEKEMLFCLEYLISEQEQRCWTGTFSEQTVEEHFLPSVLNQTEIKVVHKPHEKLMTSLKIFDYSKYKFIHRYLLIYIRPIIIIHLMQYIINGKVIPYGDAVVILRYVIIAGILWPECNHIVQLIIGANKW